ncbi:hypothetical protein M434DRAFT_30183 [Hypoxylon sp. CO27-5]|nr:hypothetical protein M434DRAFT_30183 [Hypoxylon sp. CO27-5]
MTLPNAIDDTMVVAPCRLLGLVDEMILNIFGFLLPNATEPYKTFGEYEIGKEFLPDLASLAHTCKKLNGLATEWLIKYRMHNPMEKGIFSYMRPLMENTDLASRETIFKMYPFDESGSLEEGDLERFDRIADRLGLVRPSTYPDGFIGQRKAAMEEPLFHHRRAQLAFLFVSQLPNLTSMTLYATATSGLFISSTALNRLSLPALRHAKFVGFCSRNLWNWDDTSLDFPIYIRDTLPSVNIHSFEEYFHAAPNLRVLELENMEGCTQPISPRQILSLHLNGCRLASHHMRNVLWESSKHLQSFAYRTSSYNNYLQREDVHHHWREVCPQRILDFIKYLKWEELVKLQTLEIDIRERGSISRRENTDSASMGATVFIKELRKLRYLRTLRLTQQTLWEPWFSMSPRTAEEIEAVRGVRRLTDLIPYRLQTFSLWDITIEFLPCILHLAEATRSHDETLWLKRIHLRPSPDFARQLKHAKAHLDDPILEKHHESCYAAERALNEIQRILWVFKQSSVEADFPFESHPLHTDNEADLRRQRDLEHWCLKCHFEKVGCLEKTEPSKKRGCPVEEGCLEKKKNKKDMDGEISYLKTSSESRAMAVDDV